MRLFWLRSNVELSKIWLEIYGGEVLLQYSASANGNKNIFQVSKHWHVLGVYAAYGMYVRGSIAGHDWNISQVRIYKDEKQLLLYNREIN